MQSYSHPDLFFCPLYNPPGISDPKTTLCGSDGIDTESQEYELWSSSDAGSSYSCASPSVSTTSSRSSSLSPSSSADSHADRRLLCKYKRMSAKAGKSLLEFATEVEGRRIVHEKRKQVGTLSPRARALVMNTNTCSNVVLTPARSPCPAEGLAIVSELT
ncbi:hypothetical protein C8Q76DRAFT_49896 [Earliella scabrosa]|nr:hypothetical protein C8Q76DRAFT_49896 [Earliella scabrosa]